MRISQLESEYCKEKTTRVGRGSAGRPPPPPEIGKIGVENWSYLPGVYTFGEEVEIPEIVI